MSQPRPHGIRKKIAKADPAGREALLVRQAGAGDRDAFEALVELHAPRVWRVVWRIVRDSADAEDVVQEVFLSAWRSLPDFRGEAKFSTWLHQIATSRAINHLERASEKMRRMAVSADVTRAGGGAGNEGDQQALIERFASGAPSPFAALSARERLARLRECMELLPAAWRAALALREGESMAYEDIAHALGIALGTVRSRLARARVSLRDCVEGAA